MVTHDVKKLAAMHKQPLKIKYLNNRADSKESVRGTDILKKH